MAVTQLMTAGAGLIQNLTSASETCGTTADLTKVAGLGMAGVGMMCSQNMNVCKSDCGQTGVTLKAVIADIAVLKQTITKEGEQHFANCNASLTSSPSCPIANGLFPLGAQVATVQASAQKEEGTTVGSTTLACAGLGLQVLNFANQVSDLIKSSDDADKCKKALTAGNGGGGSAITNVTTEEMCKNSANASLQVCKCHKDATAEGCPGAIAKALSKDPGGLTIKGGSGVSQLAGFGSKSGGSSGTNTSGVGSGSAGGGLSEAAKQALGLKSESATNAANGSSGISGAGSTMNSGSDLAGNSQNESIKSKKFDFGSFGSIGSGISNFFGGKGKKSGSTATITDKQIENAKRQIASAQLRNEVSTASGKSNWDKIRARYVENRGSFMGD